MSGGRGALRWSVTAVLVVALTGCAPPVPEPTPTPTGFASEDEAFAAAEATYRAYVDALNDVDLSDPETFEPVYALLTDDALRGSKKELTSLHADDLEKVGETKLAELNPLEHSREEGEVVLNVCLDVSEVDIRTANGKSVVPADRNDFQELRVVFTPDGPANLRITSSQIQSEEPCG